MARFFRRKFRSTRRPFRRRFRGGSRRPLARSSFDKITLINNLDGQFNGICYPLTAVGCSRQTSFLQPDPLCGDIGPATCLLPDGTVANPINDQLGTGNCRCCVNNINLNLINNATLESFYQDRITLMRIYGDIWFRVVPFAPVVEECEYGVMKRWMQLYDQYFGYQWHASMRKRLESQNFDNANPDFDSSSPVYGYDWTESSPPWNWQRTGLFMPRPELTYHSMNQSSLVGVCSVVTGTNPGATSTVCTPFQAPTEGCPQIFNGLNVRTPPWHHMRLRIRRHIVMQRDQALNVQLAIRMIDRSAGINLGSWACLDWGLEAPPLNDLLGRYNIEIFSRIGATIKYN